MTIAKVQAANNSALNSIALTGVGAGNLILMLLKWQDATGSNASITDGTTPLTMGTRRDYDIYASLQIGYLLSANSGNKTYTVTWPTGATQKRIFIIEFSHTGTVAFDSQNGSSGDGTTASTGNFSTSEASSVVIAGQTNNMETINSPQIGGATPTEIFAPSTTTKCWYTIYTETKTNIAATGSQTSDSWTIVALAIKETVAAGGGTILPQMMEQCGG